VPVCAGTVEWIRISATATTGRAFGTVAPYPETFSLIGDQNYDSQHQSGLEVSYPNRSNFLMGRTAVNPFRVRLDNPTYSAFDTFDYQCADFVPPVAVGDTGKGAPGAPATLSILNNHSIATANDNGPSNNSGLASEFGRTSVSLVAPTGATGVTTDAQGDVTGFAVPGQGTWNMNDTTGQLTFTPASGFTGSPTPIDYRFKSALGVQSNTAKVTIVYPAIGIAKTSVFNDQITTDGNGQVGETITYTYDVTSLSTAPLSSVTVTETGFTGAGAAPTPVFQSGETNGNSILEVGETWRYRAVYALIAADVAVGRVANQATATGRTTAGTQVSDLSDSRNSGDGNGVGTPGGGANNNDPTSTRFGRTPIDAVNDTPAALNGLAGGSTPTVLANDTLNGAAAALA
jgi:large repetitive protein